MFLDGLIGTLSVHQNMKERLLLLVSALKAEVGHEDL